MKHFGFLLSEKCLTDEFADDYSHPWMNHCGKCIKTNVADKMLAKVVILTLTFYFPDLGVLINPLAVSCQNVGEGQSCLTWAVVWLIWRGRQLGLGCWKWFVEAMNYDLVMLYGVIELGQHWSTLVSAKPFPESMLTYCQLDITATWLFV